MKKFTYNGENYCLFPYGKNFRNYTSEGSMVITDGEITESCPIKEPIFCCQKLDFSDEEVMVEFAGNNEKTIEEILSELEIDVSEMNDFLIVRTVI